MYTGKRYFILNPLESDFRDIGEFMHHSHSQEMVPSISIYDSNILYLPTQVIYEHEGACHWVRVMVIGKGQISTIPAGVTEQRSRQHCMHLIYGHCPTLGKEFIENVLLIISFVLEIKQKRAQIRIGVGVICFLPFFHGSVSMSRKPTVTQTLEL